MEKEDKRNEEQNRASETEKKISVCFRDINMATYQRAGRVEKSRKSDPPFNEYSLE